MSIVRPRELWRYAAYAALTIVPVVWLGIVLSDTLQHEAEASAVRQGAAQAEAVVKTAIEPYLKGHSLEQPLTRSEWTRISQAGRSLLDSGTVLQLRLRTVDGRVMFDASRPAALPGPRVIDPEVQEAAHDGQVVLLTSVGADEVDGGLADGPRAVEAYLAIAPRTDPDNIVGVAEIYLPYAPIAAASQASTDRLLIMIAVGLAALWLVLAGIVASVAAREKRHRAQAEQRTLHDRLTGLPGRTIFADRVDASIASCGRTATDVALVVVDVDRFKEVNDTLGHRNGDELLRIVAERLSTALRPGDTIARLGGDEFGIILPGARVETIDLILRRLQDTVAQEAELGGVVVSVETSMGYAMWPQDAETPDALQQRADLALHAAKSAKAAIVRYSEGIDEFDPQRLGLLAELRRAISGDELVLHYQPKIDALTNHVVAVEALVRWQHPTRGLLRPDEFIPIAESTGLIGPLTHWVVDTALAQLAEWHTTQPQLQLAVNISARNLRDDLPGWVLNRLAAHAVPAAQLMLEITETSFAMDPVRATMLLEELSAAGVKVSLDDFGQGYTSLGSLGHLPVTELKIDRGFVLSMEASSEDRAIVASVIELGHRLGLAVVAEGVETESVAADLRTLGCDLMQGFLFSRPLAAEHVLAVVERYATTPV